VKPGPEPAPGAVVESGKWRIAGWRTRRGVGGTGQTSAQMALRDPDIRLMLGVRSGDADAFAELVDRYQHRIVAVMHHLLGSAEEAEDLAQEVFLRIYRSRKRYHPSAKFSTWLFTIANNLALNVLRGRQRKPTVPLE